MSLEQYYTEEKIGERLVSLLPDITPTRCVELSAGEGALLLPVLKKWPRIELATCELDPENHDKLMRTFDGDHYNIDVMSPNFERVAESFPEKFDLAVCNPPFLWRKSTEYEKNLFSLYNLNFMNSWKRVRSEVVFILQNFRLINKRGIMAIILPELIVRSESFSEFRQSILDFCSIRAISQIEQGGFKGTEARTYIVIIEKGGSPDFFSFFDVKGVEEKYSQEDFILPEQGLNVEHSSYDVRSLFSIKRGCHSGKDLRLSQMPYYHTTGFSEAFKKNEPMCLDQVTLNGKSPVVAHEGDLLIHRVGSRSLGKATVVEKGAALISDCVFRVEIPKNICPHDLKKYWEEMSSKIIGASRGTCAKYITKEDVFAYLEGFFSQHIEHSNSYRLVAI